MKYAFLTYLDLDSLTVAIGKYRLLPQVDGLEILSDIMSDHSLEMGDNRHLRVAYYLSVDFRSQRP
jgi:hypothetical protein